MYLPAVLLCFFSVVFSSFSVSDYFEAILMTITVRENENHKEIRGGAFVFQDVSKNE